MASASRSALANSGREQISYRSVKNGTVTTAGTDTVTHPGKQLQLRGPPDGACVPERRRPQFPEAATLLQLLSSAADFQNAGTDVIGGTPLTRLHATRLSGLPEAPTLGRYANLTAYAKSATVPPGTLTALDVWVDSHDVMHQLKIQLLGERRPDHAHGDLQRTPGSRSPSRPRRPRTRSQLPPERRLGAAGLPRHGAASKFLLEPVWQPVACRAVQGLTIRRRHAAR